MVKMLFSTYHEGRQYIKGESYPVDKKTKDRWIKNGVAESEKEQQSYSNSLENYTNMDDDQLAAFAVSKGIDIEGKTRKQVINAIKKSEV